MKKAAVALCLLMALLVSTNPAQAVVLFSKSENDLLVDIQDPITFVATGNRNTAAFGIVFEDVYSASNTSSFRLRPPVVTSTMTIGDSVNNTYGLWGQHAGSPFRVLDDTDFYGTYFFPATTAVSIGDHVTVSAGVVTLPDFFGGVGATLPDKPVTTVQFFDRDFNALSDPVMVPEPSAFFMCLGFVSLSLTARRL